jgi:hypothetical protein
MPEEITDADVELVDQAFAEVWGLGVRVAGCETDAVWFRGLLAGLLNSTLREYQHLKLGLRMSTALLAWACRNLLELNIYVQYVLKSEANARRFAGERLADGVDIFDSFQAWAARNDPSLVTPAVDAALNSLIELKAQEESAPGRPMSTRYVSAEVGLADEYANMNKVCLKLIRPTAFSVLAGDDEGELALLRPVLFRSGAGHGLEILQALRQHLDAITSFDSPRRR